MSGAGSSSRQFLSSVANNPRSGWLEYLGLPEDLDEWTVEDVRSTAAGLGLSALVGPATAPAADTSKANGAREVAMRYRKRAEQVQMLAEATETAEAAEAKLNKMRASTSSVDQRLGLLLMKKAPKLHEMLTKLDAKRGEEEGSVGKKDVMQCFRALGLSATTCFPPLGWAAVSIGSSPMRHVSSARVSGEHMTASALISLTASSPPASRLAWRPSACALPASFSGWSTVESIATTFASLCALFHTDSPCRIM